MPVLICFQGCPKTDPQNPEIGRDLLPCGVQEETFRIQIVGVVCSQGCPKRDTHNPDIDRDLLPWGDRSVAHNPDMDRDVLAWGVQK